MTLSDRLHTLDGWLRTHAPDLADTLRPGLTEEALGEAQVDLAPYGLPGDVCTLYRWHDGQTPAGELVPGYRFLPLAEALERYRVLLDLDAAMGGWNPLWLPVLDFEGDTFIVELRRGAAETTAVFWSPNEDPDLYLWTHTLRAFIETMLDGYGKGVYRRREWGWEYDEAAEERLRRRHSPEAHRFGDHAVEGETYFSKYGTERWPEPWQEALGKKAQDYEARGTNTTVRDVLARADEEGALTVTLRGTITAILGLSIGMLVELTDETGTITLFCPPHVAREVRIRDRFEVDVRRREGSPGAAREMRWENARFEVTRATVLERRV